MPKIKHIIIGLLLLIGLNANAHDFEYQIPGQDALSKLCFKILDENRRTVELTYESKIDKNLYYVHLPDDLVIPGRVDYKGKSYLVVRIGKKAFANCVNIKKVTIPATVIEIGNFAFEGCQYLTSVVFHSDNVKIGTGAFYKCEDIKHLEFGDNWRSVDFSPFRFSNRLKEVEIPAKATEVIGLETLVFLEKISVNSVNQSFMSDNGILYSRDGKRLIFCPRNYGSTIVVREGCEEVEEHALERCINTSVLTLPKSLQCISFRETYRMRFLRTINVKNPQPIGTAFEIYEKETIGCWFFILPNSEVTIYVPKEKVGGQKSINLYRTALPLQKYGEFLSPCEDNRTPYMVKAYEIPTEKKLKEYDFNYEK